MPRSKTPSEALSEWDDYKDSDMTPNPVNARVPMWLFRQAMSAGRKLGLEDVAQTVRALLYVGQDRVLTGEITKVSEGITAAAQASPTRGRESSKPAKDGKASAPATTDLRDADYAELCAEIHRRRPATLIVDESQLVTRLAEWSRHQVEDAVAGLRKSGLRKAADVVSD